MDNEITLENWFAVHYFNMNSKEDNIGFGYGIIFLGQVKTQMPEKLMYQIRTTAMDINTGKNFQLFIFLNLQ